MARKLNVLIIDDDKADRVLVTDSLTESSVDNFDFTFFQANNNSSALQTLKAKKIDCIFLDYVLLGDENGLELLAQLSDLKINIPVVFMTGNPNEEIKKEALDMGAKFFISKSELYSEKPIQYLKEVTKFSPLNFLSNSSYSHFFSKFSESQERIFD